MLYYCGRDIGTIQEIETFIENTKPTESGIETLLRQFPDFVDSKPVAEKSSKFDGVPFPHSVVAIMGHAGSGKTHILKHLTMRARTMFYAPTNPAGINLQNTLSKNWLTVKSRKNVYRTIHSFYQIVPQETNFLGDCVMSAREGGSFISYEQYLTTMFRACTPFCDKLFARELKNGKLSPAFYHECRKHDHATTIEYIRSIGMGSSIPKILLYDVCILEEAGRTADYMAFFFLFYYYYMHVKYGTYAWRSVVPALLFVGSATQSRVVDKFTSFSALTFLGQDCMKTHITDGHFIKIKSFKDNRRVTTGDIENNTTLATVVSKLELRMLIGEKIKEKFKATFVTNAEHFFDPQFKPGHFRIAKRHAHLKRYKENLFERNGHSEVYVPEYFHCTVEDTLLSNLERFIGVKFLSETYDECWANTNERFTIFDRDLFLYKTRRTCLKGFRYLLTEYHQLYICGFSGTIDQFLETTAALHTYMTCERSSCLGYFIECAKYMIEDGHANLAPAKGQTTETSIHDLKLMESLLKSYNSSKIYAFHSEKAGTSIALPKDAFSFVLTDAIVRKSVGGPDKVRIYLTYNECLTMKMYPKVKSVSYCEVFGDDDDATLEANSVPNLSKYKRQRTGVEEDNAETKMLEKMMKLERKCYFTFVPLALYICCTIDSTQGLTINSPVLALLTQTDRAEDIIVALTRTSNPDCLLIANDIFDTNFEPIAHETKELLRLANATQKRTGWL